MNYSDGAAESEDPTDLVRHVSVRVRLVRPPPQETLQASHSVQSETWQSMQKLAQACTDKTTTAAKPEESEEAGGIHTKESTRAFFSFSSCTHTKAKAEHPKAQGLAAKPLVQAWVRSSFAQATPP